MYLEEGIKKIQIQDTDRDNICIKGLCQAQQTRDTRNNYQASEPNGI